MGRLLFAAALSLLLFVASAAPAQAACAWWSCSSVYNDRASTANVLVASRWQASTYNSSTKVALRPGASSRWYLRDVGAFWISSGCRGSSRYGTFYGGRWYRPAAGLSYVIRVRC